MRVTSTGLRRPYRRKYIGILALPVMIGLIVIGCSQSTEPPLAVPLTAREQLGSVDSFAQSYQTGLLLVTVQAGNVSADGIASTWGYGYMSTSADSGLRVYWFHPAPAGVVFDSISPLPVGISPLSATWFDSDSALSVAELNGGSIFRKNNPDYSISAAVSEPVVPNSTPAWYVYYRSGNDKTKFLQFNIDAVTGTYKLYAPD